jgi:hypothetical protein
MTREQAQILRLILMCVAWAAASTLVMGISFGPTDLVIPAILAAGVYAVTDDLGRTRITEAGKYYRGRRIDDDRPRGRWN